ncbi:MAG: hypothetical protein ACK4SY_06730 [Pyrobaculum sp.]
MISLASIGKGAFMFAILYSFLAPPLLSMFGNVPGASAFYPAYHFPIPKVNMTNVTMPISQYWELMSWITLGVLNVVTSFVGGVVLIFNNLGSAVAGSIPDPVVASFVRALFISVGGLMQLGLWSYVITVARGGNI